MLPIKTKRVSDHEAKDIITSIPSLKTILRSPSHRSITKNPKGFTYSSRFGKSGFIDTEQTENVSEETHKHHHEIESSNTFDDLSSDKPQDASVSHPGNLEKKRRYALSLATLAGKPHKRISIVNEGAIGILISLSTIHDRAIQIRCASAFASLAKEASIRARMLDEGALGAIIGLTTNSNVREVKMDCCRALCNICCEVGYEYKMIKEAVPFTTTHIASSCPDSYDICLKILLNISCVTDKIARIEDVTEALMLFFNSTLALEQEELMMEAFCNLSAIRNNQLRLVEDGCFRVIEKFMRSLNLKLRIMACEVFKNLTSDYRARGKLMELNIIGTLVEMATDECYEIRLTCIKSILYLSKDRLFRQRFVDKGGVELIVQQSLNFENTEISQSATRTLRVFCNDEVIAELLLNNGIGYALGGLLKSTDLLIRQYCAESLCALYKLKDLVPELVVQGTIDTILTLASGEINTIIAQCTAYSLLQLTLADMCPLDLLQHAVVPCLIKLSEKTVSSDQTKLFCSASFSVITKKRSVDCTSAIPLLVSMLRTERNQAMKKYCASSLFSLADVNENCYLMLDCKALLPVVQLTQSDHIKTKVICAGIISRLSLHKHYYHEFAEGDVLKVLLELSCVDHRLTQRRVVIALSNLSQDEELRSKLLLLNPIPYIISLASERDEYLRRGCISIVCNMSYLPGSEQAIVKAGIIPTLLITSLITSDQMISKLICVKALINLMADRSVYSSMVKDGVIWGLSKLAELEDEDLLALCAMALSSLSVAFAKEMISSSVAVKTVKRLIRSEDIELKKVGSRMLMNLLLQTTDTDEYFRKHSVENMTPMLSTNDTELHETCVLCLCLASQSESCRPTIVSSGILQMIDGSSIFADSRVSYAYITLFSNIANNPMMRTRVLDDHAIQRFTKICGSKDHYLELAVAKAVYCVSCSNDNIPKLVEQNVIDFIRSILDVELENSNSDELLSYIVACLYNLTTHTDVQSKLVSQGFVELLVGLWHDIEKDAKIAKLAYLAICHLACGKTNTARIVAEGCTPILCFITEHKNNVATTHYTFSYDMYYRCSAAMRNLLSVVSNQKTMVSCNCMDTLIKMADKSFDSSSKSGVGTATHAVRVNCAAAFKALTFNEDLREDLVNSEAIEIILQDVIEDGVEVSMNKGLLKELEAESWSNGARGKMRVGRGKPLEPAGLCTDYLRGVSNVQLNISLKHDELQKYYVQIQLDEPDAELNADGSETSRSSLSMIDSSNLFDDGSSDGALNATVDTKHDDGEDLQAGIVTQPYPKQECELGATSVQALNFINNERLDSFDENQAASNEDVNEITNIIRNISKEYVEHENAASAGVAAAAAASSTSPIPSPEAAAKGESASPTTSMLPVLGFSSVANFMTKSAQTLPTVKNVSIVEPLPKMSHSKSEKFVPPKKTKEELEIEELVKLIKCAKNGQNNVDLHTVMQRWYELSQF